MSRPPLRIAHIADTHIGMENYGRINPETGLNQRLHDFLHSLDEAIDGAGAGNPAAHIGADGQRPIDRLALGILSEHLGCRQIKDMQSPVQSLNGLNWPRPFEMQAGLHHLDEGAVAQQHPALGLINGVPAAEDDGEQDEGDEADDDWHGELATAHDDVLSQWR